MKHTNTKPVDYFDNRPVKEFLEDYLYTKIGNIMKSHVLQITGPALKRHYDNAIKIAPDNRFKIYWIEKERDIYYKMQQRYVEHGFNPNKMKLVLGDVVDYEWAFKLNNSCRFEDLDFCGSLDSTKHIIAHRLLTQSTTQSGQRANLTKCLMFTASLRPSGMNKALVDIQMILKEIGALLAPISTLENKATKIYNGVFKWHPVLLQRGNRLKHLWIYSYKDTHQMMTCVIIYKSGKNPNNGQKEGFSL
jgi:hypothetical protein